MIARLVNDDDVKLPHGFHETKVTKKEDQVWLNHP